MKNKQNLYVLAGIVIMMIFALPQASAAEEEKYPPKDEEAGVTAGEHEAWLSSRGYMAVGAGLAIGLAGVGTGLAQSHIGAAAVGAVAEDQKNMVNGLIFVAIPETVVILGFVIANQIMGLT